MVLAGLSDEDRVPYCPSVTTNGAHGNKAAYFHTELFFSRWLAALKWKSGSPPSPNQAQQARKEILAHKRALTVVSAAQLLAGAGSGIALAVLLHSLVGGMEKSNQNRKSLST